MYSLKTFFFVLFFSLYPILILSTLLFGGHILFDGVFIGIRVFEGLEIKISDASIETLKICQYPAIRIIVTLPTSWLPLI